MMDGRAVVITGGNAGIGLETAVALAHEGADVVNLSLGHLSTTSYRHDPLAQSVERAVRSGLVVVASAPLGDRQIP